MTFVLHPLSRAGRAVCAGLICSALLLSGCQDKKSAPTQRPAIPVTYVTAMVADEDIWVEALGETEGVKQAEVRAQVSGILEKIVYKEGDRVKEGDTLFVIDPDTYRAAYHAAVAERKQVEAQLAQEKREAARYKRLYESRAVSKKTWDDAQSAVEIRQANLRMAKANEASARINLERTSVKATSDGIVSRSLVNAGTLVSATSTLLATITQPEAMRIVFAVSERDLGGHTITLDNKVRLLLDNGKTIDAKLDYVARQIDPANASLMMRARVPAGTPGVVPGVGSDPGTNSCDGCGVSTFCPVSARAPFASGANAKKRRSFKQLPTIMISTMSSIAPMRILNFFAVIFFFIFWPPRAAPYASFLKTCFVCFSLSIYHSAASCAAPCEREASRSACPFSVSPSCK